MRRLLAALLFCAASPARAGQPCEEKPLLAVDAAKALALADRSWQALEASGAQVAIIARVGQDLSRYGLRYSHAGFVWRDHPNGRWLVVHELNECGTAQSNLYNDGLGNFFLTDLHRYEALLVIPGEQVQARIARVLSSRTALRLHQPNYNMLAYAFSTRYQNSNQWVLEAYAAATAGAGQVESREEAQRWLKLAGYRPVTVEIGAATRLGARMFRANVAFDDHPFDRRMAGQIDTVTVDSMERFLGENDKQLRFVRVFAD